MRSAGGRAQKVWGAVGGPERCQASRECPSAWGSQERVPNQPGPFRIRSGQKCGASTRVMTVSVRAHASRNNARNEVSRKILVQAAAGCRGVLWSVEMGCVMTVRARARASRNNTRSTRSQTRNHKGPPYRRTPAVQRRRVSKESDASPAPEEVREEREPDST